MAKSGGISSFVRRDGAVRIEFRNAARSGLALAAEHVLGESRNRNPFEYGDLERSSFTATSSDDLKAVIAYNVPYAVVQHEDMTLEHKTKGEAKYLENAVNAEAKTVVDIVAQTMRGAL